MTLEDLIHIKRLLETGAVIQGTVLELGAGYGGSTCQQLIEGAGLPYVTTDIHSGGGVDYVADFEDEKSLEVFGGRTFGTVLILNVLEHAFEPIRVLDNAMRLIGPGGRIVTITPSMWPIHNYPIDCQRLLPDWYREYARRRPGVVLREDVFEYVGRGPIAKHAIGDQLMLPNPWESKAFEIYSRAVHKLLNTSGRRQWAASHSAIAAVFEKQ